MKHQMAIQPSLLIAAILGILSFDTALGAETSENLAHRATVSASSNVPRLRTRTLTPYQRRRIST